MKRAAIIRQVARILSLLLLSVSFASCHKADPEAQRRAAMQLTAETMRRCLPQASVESSPGLAIAAVARETEATVLRIVAYATTQPVEFHLPIYFMSRGRWTINDTGRAYLLDENCREYKLKDTGTVVEKYLPRDGVVKLQPGVSYEFRLLFPRLPDEAQMGVLVYAGRVLPFSLLVETR
jgi:hypothetical protein